eukprot:PhF_6_TR4453/c0_g1_i1/m.6037
MFRSFFRHNHFSESEQSSDPSDLTSTEPTEKNVANDTSNLTQQQSNTESMNSDQAVLLASSSIALCERTLVEFLSRDNITKFYEVFEIPQHFQLTAGLGYGSFGYVASGTVRQSGEQLAFKKFRNVFAHNRLALTALREVLLLNHFKNVQGGTNNIVLLKDVVIPIYDVSSREHLLERMRNFDEVYIAMPLYDMNLRQLCDNSTLSFGVDERKCLLYQILRGMHCIHSARVTHRDLKPDNILVSCNFDVAVCDFGSGRALPVDSKTPWSFSIPGNVTTLWYRAPEGILQSLNRTGDAIDEDITSWHPSMVVLHSADVWSVGCILGEMMLRRPLFPGPQPIAQLETIFNVMGSPSGDYISSTFPDDSPVKKYLMKVSKRTGSFSKLFSPEKFCAEEIDLLSKMLTFDPLQRISIEEALNHPYLAEFHDPSDEPTAPPFSFPCGSSVTCTDARYHMWCVAESFHPEMKYLRELLGIELDVSNF